MTETLEKPEVDSVAAGAAALLLPAAKDAVDWCRRLGGKDPVATGVSEYVKVDGDGQIWFTVNYGGRSVRVVFKSEA
jgi:hypothetical protein